MSIQRRRGGLRRGGRCSVRAASGKFKHRDDLLTGQMKPFRNLVNGGARFQIFKDYGHGHTGILEYPCAADLARNTLHGGALGPIKSCHMPALLSYRSPRPGIGGCRPADAEREVGTPSAPKICGKRDFAGATADEVIRGNSRGAASGMQEHTRFIAGPIRWGATGRLGRYTRTSRRYRPISMAWTPRFAFCRPRHPCKRPDRRWSFHTRATRAWAGRSVR